MQSLGNAQYSSKGEPVSSSSHEKWLQDVVVKYRYFFALLSCGELTFYAGISSHEARSGLNLKPCITLERFLKCEKKWLEAESATVKAG